MCNSCCLLAFHWCSFIHSFIHCRHLYSTSSSGATQKHSQPQRSRIMLSSSSLGNEELLSKNLFLRRGGILEEEIQYVCGHAVGYERLKLKRKRAKERLKWKRKRAKEWWRGRRKQSERKRDKNESVKSCYYLCINAEYVAVTLHNWIRNRSSNSA